jgi:dolichol-phosphate mannosyltransferase
VDAVIELSVVVPVYNEAGSVETLVDDFERELVPLVENLEVVIVDDASTDDTPQILGRLAQERRWLQVHRAPQNAGHGAAVLRGLGLAQGDWIFQIDSDGQFVVAEFPRLWERRRDSDLTLGVRANRHDPLHRLVLTRVVRLAAALFAGRRVPDPNTPFRLLRRSRWEELRPLIDADTLAPNIFVTLAAVVRGWRVVEVPVTHLEREQGTSTLRYLRLLRFSLRGLGQLARFRYRLARSPAAETAQARGNA